MPTDLKGIIVTPRVWFQAWGFVLLSKRFIVSGMMDLRVL
jgi:hypothetical protein